MPRPIIIVPIAWDEAFARIGGRHARVRPSRPDGILHLGPGVERSGLPLSVARAREFGTNNFPDCSNMCHEATSVGLPKSIGVGKGTVTLEDFDHADAIFCIGHNPGTNHPRMLTTLREGRAPRSADHRRQSAQGARARTFPGPAKPDRDADAVVDPARLGLLSGPKVGGDAAMLKGMMKALLAADRDGDRHRRGRAARPRLHRRTHRSGIEALVADIDATGWAEIERRSGLRQAQIEAMAEVYWQRRARDRLLRHGHHPAPPRHRKRPADRQSAAAARQYRPARRRHLPAARPQQRAGRSHRRHHRNPDRGFPGAARRGVRNQRAAQAWS
jgi:anaerobic selenocysteine-containing dehydrogenase